MHKCVWFSPQLLKSANQPFKTSAASWPKRHIRVSTIVTRWKHICTPPRLYEWRKNTTSTPTSWNTTDGKIGECALHSAILCQKLKTTLKLKQGEQCTICKTRRARFNTKKPVREKSAASALHPLAFLHFSIYLCASSDGSHAYKEIISVKQRAAERMVRAIDKQILVFSRGTNTLQQLECLGVEEPRRNSRQDMCPRVEYWTIALWEKEKS